MHNLLKIHIYLLLQDGKTLLYYYYYSFQINNYIYDNSNSNFTSFLLQYHTIIFMFLFF